MTNENGKRLESSLRMLGIMVNYISESISPQLATYYFDYENIAQYSKIKLQNAVDKLSLYNHRKFKIVYSDFAHFGISMPNKQVAPLWITNLKQPSDKNAITIGVDLENKNVELDFNTIVHLLIAGTTGSGKTVLLNTILFSLYSNLKADNFELKIIDPKRTDLQIFKHFDNCEFIDETTDAIALLSDLVNEMESRYMRKAQGETEFKPIYVVVDELADLMLSSRYDVEESIVRLAQKSRAANIHLILATQRPTVNVITGNIKTNLDNRICLKMASQIDSRTVLDHKGAEELLGRGDAILKQTGTTTEIRFQCAMISKSNLEKAILGGN